LVLIISGSGRIEKKNLFYFSLMFQRVIYLLAALVDGVCKEAISKDDVTHKQAKKMEPPSSDGPFLWKAKPTLPNCTARNHDFDRQRTGRKNPPFLIFCWLGCSAHIHWLSLVSKQYATCKNEF